MFDPTVYENLKVVLEGAVYDRDLDGSVLVTGREDWVNLAVMARSYRIAFQLADRAADASGSAEASQGGADRPVEAELVLSTELADLASEILELDTETPGCSLVVSFRMKLQAGQPVEPVCQDILASMRRLWGGRFGVQQTLSFEYGEEPAAMTNRIRLLFGRRFGEEVAEDFAQILDHTVLALRELERIQNLYSK